MKIKTFVLFIAIFVFSSFVGFGQDTATSAAPAATPKPATARFTPNKDQIMKGQAFLKSKDLFTGEATGKYDDATRDAIRVYQKENSLTVTGNFNEATLEKMGIATAKVSGDRPTGTATAGIARSSSDTDAAASTGGDKTQPTKAATTGPKRPPVFRANKAQIMEAQKILRDGKMLTGGEDGKLDDLTRVALTKYREANSLPPGNTLNAETLEKMGIALTDTQKATVAAKKAYDDAKQK